MKKLILLLPLALFSAEPPSGLTIKTNTYLYRGPLGQGTQIVYSVQTSTNRWVKAECNGPEASKTGRIFGWKQISLISTNK